MASRLRSAGYWRVTDRRTPETCRFTVLPFQSLSATTLGPDFFNRGFLQEIDTHGLPEQLATLPVCIVNVGPCSRRCRVGQPAFAIIGISPSLIGTLGGETWTS